MTPSIRAFIALELPEAVSAALEAAQTVLQEKSVARGLKWVEPHDAHLTLKFLGEVPVDHLPGLVDALDTVAERWQPFDLQLEALGAFPNVYRPNVLWVGATEGANAVVRLYNSVEVALKRLGIKPERGEFTPHVTLARVPKGWSTLEREAVGNLVGAVDLPALPLFTVGAVALIRSQLTPDGPEYSRIGNSRFSEPPPLRDDDWEDEE